MALKPWIIPIGILVISVLCIGCMGTPTTTSPVATVTPTPIPTPSPTPTIPPMRPVVWTNVTTTPTPEPTLEAIEPDWTEVPITYPPTESDTAKINFTEFKNEYLTVKYPDTWTTEKEFFILKELGQYGNDNFRPEAEAYLFQSEDKNTSLKVSRYTFISRGRTPVPPTIDTIRTAIINRYPDGTYSSVYVNNFQYKSNEQNVFTTKYDISIPNLSIAYTEEVFYTFNFYWTVRFTDKGGDVEKYQDLKDTMMKSVTTEGLQKGRG